MHFTNISSTLFPGPTYGHLNPSIELPHTSKASIRKRKQHNKLKKFSLSCFRKGWRRKIRYFESQICHVEQSMFVLCLKLSACRQTKLFYLTRPPVTNISTRISTGVSHVSIRPINTYSISSQRAVQSVERNGSPTISQ